MNDLSKQCLGAHWRLVICNTLHTSKGAGQLQQRTRPGWLLKAYYIEQGENKEGAICLLGDVLLVTQSCPTLCDPADCSPPGSSVRGILQASIWGGLPFPSPGDLPDPGIQPMALALADVFFTTEPPGKPRGHTLILEVHSSTH